MGFALLTTFRVVAPATSTASPAPRAAAAPTTSTRLGLTLVATLAAPLWLVGETTLSVVGLVLRRMEELLSAVGADQGLAVSLYFLGLALLAAWSAALRVVRKTALGVAYLVVRGMDELLTTLFANNRLVFI
jgi:hypothetical protein